MLAVSHLILKRLEMRCSLHSLLKRLKTEEKGLRVGSWNSVTIRTIHQSRDKVHALLKNKALNAEF